MRHALKTILAIALALLAGACAAPATAPKAGPAAVVYPMPPDPPRIQHLVTLRGELDLGPDQSNLARFVAGEKKAPLRLKQPYGLAFTDGKLYVVDTKGPGFAVFDFVKRSFSQFPGTSGGRMQRPINLTIDADGTRYVTDTGRNDIIVFDREDRFLRTIGTPGQFKPVDIAIAGDRLYVVDIQNHQVQVLDKRTGQVLNRIAKAGSGPGDLFHPTNIAFAPNGDLLVVDTSNFRVQRFTRDGVAVRSFGEAGQVPGTFARPKGIAVDRAGRIYVGDSAFQNVQLFDPDGKLLLYFGQPGGDREGLNLPTDVVIDYDNVGHFTRYAAPGFRIEYLIAVSSQFEPTKVDIFGFGKAEGAKYPEDAKAK